MAFIPSLQSVSPFYFLRFPNQSFQNTFPFNHPRIKYFYFARNGIYHLGKRLKEMGKSRMLFPAYNHGNEIRALLAAGVKLEYYNILPNTDIDFADVERKIKETGIDVFYFIHYVGLPQNITHIKELKEKYNLLLIEDNALGLFSRFKDEPLGSTGDASIFCLYKTLPIPNGGALVLNNFDLDFEVQTVTPQRVSTLSRLAGLLFFWLDLHFWGFGRKLQNLKSNLSGMADKMDVERVPVLDSGFDVQRASWGMAGVSHYLAKRISPKKVISQRRKNFQFMLEHIPASYHLFSELPQGAVPWFFPVKLNNREFVFQELTRSGVDCARFWRQSHPDIPADRFPDVLSLRNSILELPIHQDLNERHLSLICNQFNKIVDKND